MKEKAKAIIKHIHGSIQSLERQRFIPFRLSVNDARPFKLLGNRKVIFTCTVLDKVGKPVQADVMSHICQQITNELTDPALRYARPFRNRKKEIGVRLTFMLPSR